MEELLRSGLNLSLVDKILTIILVGLTWLALSHLLLQLQEVPEKDRANLRVQLLKEAVEKETHQLISHQDYPQEIDKIDRALQDPSQKRVRITEAS